MRIEYTSAHNCVLTDGVIMWFVLLDDIDTDDGCQYPGKILNQDQMQYLVDTCDCVKSVAFSTEDAAIYYANHCMSSKD